MEGSREKKSLVFWVPNIPRNSEEELVQNLRIHVEGWFRTSTSAFTWRLGHASQGIAVVSRNAANHSRLLGHNAHEIHALRPADR